MWQKEKCNSIKKWQKYIPRGNGKFSEQNRRNKRVVYLWKNTIK